MNTNVYSEDRINDISLYEHIQKNSQKDSENLSRKFMTHKSISNLVKDKTINIEKIQKYFERILYDHVYRLNELLIFLLVFK